MERIDTFKGKNFFLSNFYEAPVEYDGLQYQNSEAAFQAQKTRTKEERKAFRNLNPSKAKALGRRIDIRPDWDNVKFDIMLNIVRNKFAQNPDLKKKLIKTGDAYLEEGNDWGDRIWGVCNGVGENHLGQILMIIRNELNFWPTQKTV